MPQVPERSRTISDKLDKTFAGNDELIHAKDLNVIVPPLKALITVRRDLSPLTLDSSYVQPFDLKDSLEVALEKNLNLSVTRNNADRDHYFYKSAKGYFLPDLGTTFTQAWIYGQIGLPYTKNQLFGSNTSAGNSTLFTLAFPYSINTTSLRYWLYRGGAVVYGAKQAKHEIYATRAQNFANYSDVLRDMSNFYYKLLLSEAILQIRIRAVDRFELGLGTQLDVLTAQRDLTQAQINLATATIQYNISQVDLVHSLGLCSIQNLTDAGRLEWD